METLNFVDWLRLIYDSQGDNIFNWISNNIESENINTTESKLRQFLLRKSANHTTDSIIIKVFDDSKINND